MSRFAEHAHQILDAAEAAAARGEASEMTILIGEDGGIHMIANSDWPLDSLALHHGARAVYRMAERNGKLTRPAKGAGAVCWKASQRIRSWF